MSSSFYPLLSSAVLSSPTIFIIKWKFIFVFHELYYHQSQLFFLSRRHRALDDGPPPPPLSPQYRSETVTNHKIFNPLNLPSRASFSVSMQFTVILYLNPLLSSCDFLLFFPDRSNLGGNYLPIWGQISDHLLRTLIREGQLGNSLSYHILLRLHVFPSWLPLFRPWTILSLTNRYPTVSLSLSNELITAPSLPLSPLSLSLLTSLLFFRSRWLGRELSPFRRRNFCRFYSRHNFIMVRWAGLFENSI